MQQIYCISGLGADHRIFERLHMPGYELVAVPWLVPLPQDTLATYAARMYASIPDAGAVILGLSFGGMVATEIKKQFSPANVIIVSSAKTREEIGYNSRFFSWFANKPFLPDRIFITPYPFILYMLGASAAADSALLASMIEAGVPSLNRWMVNALLGWGCKDVPEGITHIHGTHDRVIRPRGVQPTHWIKGGSHFMIYNRAAEVSAIISQVLSSSPKL